LTRGKKRIWEKNKDFPRGRSGGDTKRKQIDTVIKGKTTSGSNLSDQGGVGRKKYGNVNIMLVLEPVASSNQQKKGENSTEERANLPKKGARGTLGSEIDI